MICDGVADCPNYEDEENCGEAIKCMIIFKYTLSTAKAVKDIALVQVVIGLHCSS